MQLRELVTTGVGDDAPLLRSTVRVANWPAETGGEANAISGCPSPLKSPVAKVDAGLGGL